jgi:hypothetical protein
MNSQTMVGHNKQKILKNLRSYLQYHRRHPLQVNLKNNSAQYYLPEPLINVLSLNKLMRAEN